MVERRFDSLQQEIFNFSPTSVNTKPRYIITRPGCELSRPDNKGAMVRGGTKVSHKCLEAQGTQINCNIFHIKGKGCNNSSHPHRQHESSVILNESGGYQKPGFDSDQQRNLAIPFETLTITFGILIRVNECRGR